MGSLNFLSNTPNATETHLVHTMVDDLKSEVANSENLRKKMEQIRTLTPTDARALVNFLNERWIDFLRLANLTSLDEATAVELAKFKGTHLNLQGLKSLSRGALLALAKYEWNGSEAVLSLIGLYAFPNDTAEEFFNTKTPYLKCTLWRFIRFDDNQRKDGEISGKYWRRYTSIPLFQRERELADLKREQRNSNGRNNGVSSAQDFASSESNQNSSQYSELPVQKSNLTSQQEVIVNDKSKSSPSLGSKEKIAQQFWLKKKEWKDVYKRDGDPWEYTIDDKEVLRYSGSGVRGSDSYQSPKYYNKETNAWESEYKVKVGSRIL